MECWSNGMMGCGTTQYSGTPLFQHSGPSAMFAMALIDNDSPLTQELRSLAGVRVKLGEPLARYTSMKIGGPADCFIEVQNATALAALLPLLQQHHVPLCLLGNGSNVLISDRGVRGA